MSKPRELSPTVTKTYSPMLSQKFQFTVTYKPCNHELVIWEGLDDEKPTEITDIPAACPFCAGQPTSDRPA